MFGERIFIWWGFHRVERFSSCFMINPWNGGRKFWEWNLKFWIQSYPNIKNFGVQILKQWISHKARKMSLENSQNSPTNPFLLAVAPTLIMDSAHPEWSQLYCFASWTRAGNFFFYSFTVLLWHSPDCQTHRGCMPSWLASVRTKRPPTSPGGREWTLATQPQSIGR